MFACATHGLATFRVLFVNVLSIFVNGTFILSRNNKTLIVCTDKRLIRLKNWGKGGGERMMNPLSGGEEFLLDIQEFIAPWKKSLLNYRNPLYPELFKNFFSPVWNIWITMMQRISIFPLSTVGKRKPTLSTRSRIK